MNNPYGRQNVNKNDIEAVSDVLKSEHAKASLKYDDVYIYVTQVPDTLASQDPKVVRAYQIFGLNFSFSAPLKLIKKKIRPLMKILHPLYSIINVHII